MILFLMKQKAKFEKKEPEQKKNIYIPGIYIVRKRGNILSSLPTHISIAAPKSFRKAAVPLVAFSYRDVRQEAFIIFGII